MNRKLLASALSVGVLTAPVAIAVADETETEALNQTPDVTAAISEERRITANLKRAAARAEARREARAERKAEARKRAKKRAKKRAERRQAAAAPKQQAAPKQSGGGGTATPGHLAAIAACESGGDPSAVGGGGAYRGKYQFDRQTWASVGGSGDPAAAPEAEQDKRAAMLYSRAGASPWPVCGR